MNTITRRCTLAIPAILAALMLTPAAAQGPVKLAAVAPTPAAAQRTFASPEEAVKNLVDALRGADMKGLAAIIGPGSDAWIRSGDAVQDEQDRQRFLAAYDEKNALEAKGADQFVLAIGADAWPFAVPIVKKGSQWAFDAKAGREEIANRRVGRNELDTIMTLLAVVEAQRQYAAADAGGHGVPAYARRFLSSEGKKDGLYWPTNPGETASPLGPLADSALEQGYAGKASSSPQPYKGYYYRMLTAQGKDARGGAGDYVVKGQLTRGFAVVAYPVKYGVSGIMTFLVNNDGVIYEKDLGNATASAAGSMTRYDPGTTWRKSQP